MTDNRSLGTLLNEIKTNAVEFFVSGHPGCQLSLGGRVRDVVAHYESIDHIGSNVCFICMWALQRLLDIFFMKKVNFVKIRHLPLINFRLFYYP